jgi:hypothetical protein
MSSALERMAKEVKALGVRPEFLHDIVTELFGSRTVVPVEPIRDEVSDARVLIGKSGAALVKAFN